MGETFFIKINCSKILENCEESQYTMCVDSTKMSIVYELTEWIRWMFSLEHCFYLVHEDSVIHELEDIQFLSKLKNFEIRPCGQPNCVHKKMYRSLLDNLNLFVSWNNVKVHKYFLDKLSKMAKNLPQENPSGNSSPKDAENAKIGQNSMKNSAKTKYNNFFFYGRKQGDSNLEGTPLTKKQVLIDNFVSKPEISYGLSGETNCSEDTTPENIFNNYKDNFKTLSDFKGPENKQLQADSEKRNETLISHSSPIKNELKVSQGINVNLVRPNSNKSLKRHVRPFSVGELLSNIRDGLEKQNMEGTNKSSNTSNNSSVVESEKFDEKIGDEANLLTTDDNKDGVRKRSRTRKRKRSKKHSPEDEDPPVSPFLSALLNISNTKCGLTTPKSASKPNHIRFDFDNDLTETGQELSPANASELKISEGIRDGSMTVGQTEPNKLGIMIGDKIQEDYVENGFSMNNTENEMEISSESGPPTAAEAKLIDFDQTFEKANHSSNTPEISKPSNEDLKVLLNLKEKFKSAVVIERFY